MNKNLKSSIERVNRTYYGIWIVCIMVVLNIFFLPIMRSLRK